MWEKINAEEIWSDDDQCKTDSNITNLNYIECFLYEM